ncbi:MAG: 3'(2'),5'-bisphosphate nucleotidase CysQ [Cytophagaceae bacterium]
MEWNKIDIEKINRIALLAGEKIMEIYNDADFSKVVDFKADHSPLTLADKASHNVIEEELFELGAGLPLLSEEGRTIEYDERRAWNTFWLVDPLDGTKEFIKRNGEFTVNIALIEQGTPVLGVIYAPATNKLYYAIKGQGAWKREGGNTIKIQTGKKENNWIAVGSRSHSAPEEQTVLSKYPVTDSVSIGSSLKFCLLAEGQADIYYRHGPTMEWDTGAGQAILEAAGGKMLDNQGNLFVYNKQSLTNSSFLCLSHIR